MIEALNGILTGINNSKIMMAFLMLTLNVGSKYVDFGFSKTQEQILRNGLSREMLIFAISFTATRDVLISFMITSAFFVLSNNLFNEKSKFCLIPERMKRIKILMDTDNDGEVSIKEEEKALEILKRADKQRKKNIQGTFLSHLATTSTLI